jgi:metal-responsive CopG/Arc/MetJ family transcriptional regulator
MNKNCTTIGLRCTESVLKKMDYLTNKSGIGNRSSYIRNLIVEEYQRVISSAESPAPHNAGGASAPVGNNGERG